jgi:hypothetical protein
MPNLSTSEDIAAARAFAAVLAKQNNSAQCVVTEKETGNVYVISPASLKQNEGFELQAKFDNEGNEKPISQIPPVITYEVTAFRTGANQHTAIIWQLEDNEATTQVGNVVVLGNWQKAIDEGQKAITKFIADNAPKSALQVVK